MSVSSPAGRKALSLLAIPLLIYVLAAIAIGWTRDPQPAWTKFVPMVVLIFVGARIWIAPEETLLPIPRLIGAVLIVLGVVSALIYFQFVTE